MAEHDTHNSTIAAKASSSIKSSRFRRFTLWSVGIVLAIALLGFFAAPPLVKAILLKQLSTQLHREVSVGEIAINPFALTAQISAVSVKTAGGKEAFGFDELFVNLSALSIAQAAPVVDEIRLGIAPCGCPPGRWQIRYFGPA